MLFPSFHESEIDMASVLLLLLLSRLSIDLNWGAAFPSSLPLSFTVLNSIIFIHLREKEGREGEATLSPFLKGRKRQSGSFAKRGKKSSSGNLIYV